MKVLYHYIIRYNFKDRKKAETGYGVFPYSSIIQLSLTDIDSIKAIERMIAKNRSHESVSVLCFSFLRSEIRK